MPKLEMTNRDDILAHWGTEGMHWGERRYQNYDGSLTEEGRRHYGIGKPRMSKAEKLNLKKKKQQEKNLKKARNAKKKQAKQEQKAVKDAENLLKKKQKIYERGDAAEIYKNRKLFTTEEYQKAIQRAETFSKSKPQKEVKPVKVDDGKMHSFQLSIGGTKGSSDAAKQKIINSGDPKLVKKNLSKLNDQELRSAIEHIKGMQELNKNIPNKKSLKDLLKAQKDRETTKKGKLSTEQVLKGAQTVSNLFKTGTEMYNNYNFAASSLNNILGEDKLPVFQATGTNFKSFNDQLNAKATAKQNAKNAQSYYEYNPSTTFDLSPSTTNTWKSLFDAADYTNVGSLGSEDYWIY